MREEESDEKPEPETQTVAQQLGIDKDDKLASLFDAPVAPSDAQGMFGKNIADAANQFATNIPQSQKEKREAVQTKLINQANVKLTTAV